VEVADAHRRLAERRAVRRLDGLAGGVPLLARHLEDAELRAVELARLEQHLSSPTHALDDLADDLLDAVVALVAPAAGFSNAASKPGCRIRGRANPSCCSSPSGPPPVRRSLGSAPSANVGTSCSWPGP
jgi:hypothetical protein